MPKKIYKRIFFRYNNNLNCTMRMFECNKNGNGWNIINEMNEAIAMDMMEADEDVYQYISENENEGETCSIINQIWRSVNRKLSSIFSN